jgi:hypothetical protein
MRITSNTDGRIQERVLGSEGKANDSDGGGGRGEGTMPGRMDSNDEGGQIRKMKGKCALGPFLVVLVVRYSTHCLGLTS